MEEILPFCTNCGKEIPAETLVCPYCEILVEPQKALGPTQPMRRDGHSISLGKILTVGFFCFLCFGVMLGGILMVYRYQKATSTFTETLAIVTKTEYSGSDVYVLTLQFVEKNTGNKITAKCSTIDQSIANRGQVSILYDPTNPTNVELKATYEGGYLINALVAMIPGAIIIVFIITMLMKRRATQLKIDRQIKNR